MWTDGKADFEARRKPRLRRSAYLSNRFPDPSFLSNGRGDSHQNDRKIGLILEPFPEVSTAPSIAHTPLDNSEYKHIMKNRMAVPGFDFGGTPRAVSPGGLTMIIDNLSIAGALIASLYALLPLVFRKELIRVEDETEPCQEAASPCGPASMGRPLIIADDA